MNLLTKLKEKYIYLHRDLRIDSLKGLVIIFMVTGHIIQARDPDFWNNKLFLWIYSFHMPLFMVISGYLSYFSFIKHKPLKIILGKIKQLIIPYFSWYLIFCYFYLRSIHNVDFIGYLTYSVKYPDTGLWFLLILFYIFIIFALAFQLKKVIIDLVKVRNINSDVIEILLITLFVVIIQLIPINIWGFGLLRVYIYYFYFGYLISKYYFRFRQFANITKELLLVFYPLIIIYYLNTQKTAVEIFKLPKDMGMLMNAFMGIGFLSLIMKRFKNSEFIYILAWLGIYSFDIYVISWNFWFLGFTGRHFDTFVAIILTILMSLLISFTVLRQSKILKLLFLGQ